MLPATMEPVSPPQTAVASVANGLPLTPIERFLHRNDAPRNPMVFRVLMQYEGPYQQDKLTDAFRLAIRRQPLLTSRITGFDREATWQSSGLIPDLLWQPAGMTAEQVAQVPIDHIDLATSPGMHCRIFPIPDGVVILLDIHHVCCDGQGARQFLSEWFGLYQQMLAGNDLKFAAMDYDQLQHRGNFRVMNPPIGTFEGLRNLYLTVRGKTVHLPRQYPASTASDFLFEHIFSPEETTQLRQTLKKNEFSINDAGLAASFSSFVTHFPQETKRGYITLMHPVDLRWPSDLRTPACNRVGASFLRRKQRDCRDPRKLLLTVRDQMKYVKQRYVGAEFIRGLAAADGLSGGPQRIQNWGWFVPSLQFTCLGDTTRALHYRFHQVDGVINFGGLKLQRISGFMQLGPYLPISLAACETNQRLVLTARASARHISEEQARTYLDLFVARFIELGMGM